MSTVFFSCERKKLYGHTSLQNSYNVLYNVLCKAKPLQGPGRRPVAKAKSLRGLGRRLGSRWDLGLMQHRADESCGEGTGD